MGILNDNIKKARSKTNKTLEDIALQVGVSKQTIQKYESGVITNIPSDKIEKIAIALDVTPAYLMGWENNTKETTNNSLENLPKDEKEVLSLYKELDIEDRAEIRGTIKGMLKAEKYSTSKSKLHA